MHKHWYPYWKRSQAGRVRLLCLPYAGASCNVFLDWYGVLPEYVELVPIELPGRLTRLKDEPRRNFEQLVEELVEAVQPLTDLPIALLGCSMGGLLGYELARRLSDVHSCTPVHLFVLARPGPSVPPRLSFDESASDHHFLEFVQKHYGGLPRALLMDPEMRQIIIRVLRADFTLLAGYPYRPRPPVRFDITAIGGTGDEHVTRDDLLAWRSETSGAFSVRMFPGNHFFANDNRRQIGALIEQVLHREIGRARPANAWPSSRSE